jgi:hypothetical protein
MKSLTITICAILLVGCASSRQSTSLTPDQASTLAVRLVNHKAATLYHCQPFHVGQAAHLVAGHWVWAGQQGFGQGDLRARVELAADGSTNDVALLLLDSHDFRPF